MNQLAISSFLLFLGLWQVMVQGVQSELGSNKPIWSLKFPKSITQPNLAQGKVLTNPNPTYLYREQFRWDKLSSQIRSSGIKRDAEVRRDQANLDATIYGVKLIKSIRISAYRIEGNTCPPPPYIILFHVTTLLTFFPM